MTNHRLNRRDFIRLLGVGSAGALGVYLAGCAQPTPTPAPKVEPTKAAVQPTTAPKVEPTAVPKAAGGYAIAPKTKGEIVWWHHWGSPVRRGGVRRIIGAFNAIYPDIKVTETFVTFGDGFTKVVAAVAAGSGMPDVMTEDRPQLFVRAANKVEISLAELCKRDGVDGKAFWPFTWKEATVNGEPYGLPYETDIRVLFSNQYLLKEAGLDPEKPPKDWDELFAAADKLDKKGADGKLACVAFWPNFGNIGLDGWVWNAGGEYVDKDNNPTINSKEAVEALTFMKKWADRYSKANWDAFMGAFGQGNQDGFMSSKVAMKVDIAGYMSFINFYDPRTKDNARLLWAATPIPCAPGKKPASFSGGFALSIPRGSKAIDQAWEFIKYATFEGQASWARDTFAMPTIEKVAREDPVLNADPHWKFFVDAMAYGRPAFTHPYYPSMTEVFAPALDAVWAGKQTPQQALDEAQKKAEAEIAKNKK